MSSVSNEERQVWHDLETAIATVARIKKRGAADLLYHARISLFIAGLLYGEASVERQSDFDLLGKEFGALFAFALKRGRNDRVAREKSACSGTA